MKRILMIAYHFPPLAGSSGIQRTLRFVQHLPSLGWQPLVLSANPRAYEETSDDLLGDVPAGTVVHRAFALDTARHLQFSGRYLGWMARPDRWISWKFDAIRQGLKLIEEFQPDVIWSTYPIATAHVIASALHRKTGIPWVADFRDPMAQEGYPADRRTWQSYLDIEARAAAQARYCVFTTPGAARMYQQRYPAAASRMVVLENGYDEESFASAALPPQVARAPADGERPLLMLHSGIVYPSERDPTQLFAALGHLQKAGTLSPADLRIRFRASVHDDLLQSLAQTHGAQDFIELCPALPYREALSEITSSKSELESLLGEPVTLFGYPNGKPDVDYSAKHVAMVRQAGYVAAVSTAPGVAMWTSDIYQLPRFTPWDRTRSRYGMRLLANLRRSASQVVASTVT